MSDAIRIHTLRTKSGMECTVANYGCRIMALSVKNREGASEDIVLGFDRIRDYFEHPEFYFGAFVGPVANRVSQAQFKLNGKIISLDRNHGRHHIHGGSSGFHGLSWDVEEASDSRILFSKIIHNPPSDRSGVLRVKLAYFLDDTEGLRIQYFAETTCDTPFNPTNHSYFNLMGAGNGSIDHHFFQFTADRYLPITSEQLPEGIEKKVDDSDFDFRLGSEIGPRLKSTDEQLRLGMGFDHHFIVPGEGLRRMAYVREPLTGIGMEVFSDATGFQFFCGKAMDRTVVGKNGKSYAERSAFCIETQGYPNSVNEPGFPSVILPAGKVFESTTIYKFRVD